MGEEEVSGGEGSWEGGGTGGIGSVPEGRGGGEGGGNKNAGGSGAGSDPFVAGQVMADPVAEGFGVGVDEHPGDIAGEEMYAPGFGRLWMGRRAGGQSGYEGHVGLSAFQQSLDEGGAEVGGGRGLGQQAESADEIRREVGGILIGGADPFDFGKEVGECLLDGVPGEGDADDGASAGAGADAVAASVVQRDDSGVGGRGFNEEGDVGEGAAPGGGVGAFGQGEDGEVGGGAEFGEDVLEAVFGRENAEGAEQRGRDAHRGVGGEQPEDGEFGAVGVTELAERGNGDLRFRILGQDADIQEGPGERAAFENGWAPGLEEFEAGDEDIGGAEGVGRVGENAAADVDPISVGGLALDVGDDPGAAGGFPAGGEDAAGVAGDPEGELHGPRGGGQGAEEQEKA